METRQIHIGSLAMGGGAPVCIQSMTQHGYTRHRKHRGTDTSAIRSGL